MTCCQWATVRFRHLCAHSKWRRRWLAVSWGFVVGRSICPVTTGQESVVNRCVTSPHSVQISHPRRQGLSTQETILSDHPQQCTVLPRCCLSGCPWRLAWHQRSSGNMPFEYAVDGSTSQTHTGSNSTLLNALTGKCKHLMPNTHRGWTGHCSNNQRNFWKICKYWFKVVTVWRLIWGNKAYSVVSELDDPTCPCIECLPKVVSDFVGEQLRVHIMSISAKWKHKSSIHIGFIVFNGGVTTFLAKSIYWSQALSGAWRCSWSSADRRCSNYIWVINNLIAH